MKESYFTTLKKDIMNAEMSEADRTRMLRNLAELQDYQLNILITGATGCGKSSTINALFDMSVAKVGVGVDPETTDIRKYELDGMTIWDSPGLGDGVADQKHIRNIIDKLCEVDADGKALIDLVIVILDGGSRDLGTSYELINKVIIPNLGEDAEKRILVAINQADVAMKGRNWDVETNSPNETLKAFLEEKADSVRRRIYESTKVAVDPIYYAAGYTESDGMQCKPYNLAKLLNCILNAIPGEKRLIVVNHLNEAEGTFRINDNADEALCIGELVVGSVVDHISTGTEIGEAIGEGVFGLFGETAEKVGGFVGRQVGRVVSFATAPLRAVGSFIRGLFR